MPTNKVVPVTITHRKPNGRSLDTNTRYRIQKVVERVGPSKFAQEMGTTTNTVARLIAGFPTHELTIRCAMAVMAQFQESDAP